MNNPDIEAKCEIYRDALRARYVRMLRDQRAGIQTFLETAEFDQEHQDRVSEWEAEQAAQHLVRLEEAAAYQETKDYQAAMETMFGEIGDDELDAEALQPEYPWGGARPPSKKRVEQWDRGT